jgi:hypothetical protein
VRRRSPTSRRWPLERGGRGYDQGPHFLTALCRLSKTTRTNLQRAQR